MIEHSEYDFDEEQTLNVTTTKNVHLNIKGGRPPKFPTNMRQSKPFRSATIYNRGRNTQTSKRVKDSRMTSVENSDQDSTDRP